jgi:hypothetical protein
MDMESKSFDRFGGACAILAGISGLLYSVSFVILKNDLLDALLLLLGALLSVVVLIGLYTRLQETDNAFALLALLVGMGAALASTLHGGYNLANAINAPGALPGGVADLPSPTDPRGLATFGLTGLSVLLFAWLIVRSGSFPKSLGYLGYLLAVLLIIIYLGRLIVLSATSPLFLIPAAVTGFIVNPLWYIWLGREFLGQGASTQTLNTRQSARA